MGGGASKGAAAGANQTMAIKEIKERAEKLEREVEKLEQEKKAYEKQLADRASDVEKLGEINRNAEREKKAVEEATSKAKVDLRSAEKAMEVMRREMEDLKSNSSKFEASLRELKGDLIVEKEDHMAAREEIDRIGQMLTEKEAIVTEKEMRLQELEEEKKELDNMLRLASESADMYKDLSSKLMVKKPKEEAAPAAAAPVIMPKAGDKSKPQVEAAKAEVSSEEKLLEKLELKQPGRFKVVIISTFEDFFLERKALKENTVRPLNDWCDQNECVLEMVDLWEGMLRDQYTTMTHGFHIPSLYFAEIEDADVVLVLLAERYGADITDETCANEAIVRSWMNGHRSQHNRYGSILELASVYASFIVGHDSNLPKHLRAPRVITYIRDPAYIQGLPEQMTKHFVQESQKQTAKLEQLKARVAKAGLVRNASYADPHALSHQVFEDLLQIFSRSQPKAPSGIEIEITTHTAYMDGHAWIGQGEKGVQLPESVISIMERIRKYAALTHFIPDLPAHFITFPSLHHISCRIVLLPESVACRPCT
jgi:chemotaxis protein histidine kinase CheA